MCAHVFSVYDGVDDKNHDLSNKFMNFHINVGFRKYALALNMFVLARKLIVVKKRLDILFYGLSLM